MVWQKTQNKSDYINVTLDIGYTMLFNMVDAILQVYGFDTYYGVFHRCFYMRKSLVCDIMEPMRPIIDYEIRKAANVYVDSIMKRTEEGVATQLEALRKTHANIVSSQKKQG